MKYGTNDASYANEVLKVSLNTYKKCVKSLGNGELTLRRSKLVSIISNADLDPQAYGLDVFVGGGDKRFGNYHKRSFRHLCGRFLIYRRSFLTASDITCGVLDIGESPVHECLTFVERHHYLSELGQIQKLEYSGNIYMDEGQALLSLPAYENGKVRLVQLMAESVEQQVKLRGAMLTFGSPRGIWQPTISCIYAVGPINNANAPIEKFCKTIKKDSKEFDALSAQLEHVEQFTSIVTPLMFARSQQGL